MDFGIWLLKNMVSVIELTNNNLEVMKNNGEKSFIFENKSFWKWFQKKISYKGEPLSFIIITEKNTEFIIPDDIKIKDKIEIKESLVKKFASLSKDGFTKELKVLTFPNSENIERILKNKKVIKKKTVPSKQSSNEILKENTGIDPIVDYYIEKTDEYESDN